MARRTPAQQRPRTRAGRLGPTSGKPAASAKTTRNRWLGLLVIVVAVLAIVLAARMLPPPLDKGAGTANPLAGDDPGVAHVHGLGVDPADGTMYAATHHGVFRIPESGKAIRIADRYQDTMGFAVVGPRHFLGSGHPDLREDKPVRLGLIESTDAGHTWHALSLEGQTDFHALEVAHGLVYGYDTASGRFMVTLDRRSWDSRSELPMADFAVNPDDPDTILATTERGLSRSTDGGRRFAAVQGAPPLLLIAWPSADMLYGVTGSGAVMVSTDGGVTWQQRASLDGRPEAITASDKETVHAATESGIYTSTDSGRTFGLRYRG